jgi:hypothetical protein
MLDQLTTEAIAEAGPFARGAEDEEAGDAAFDEVLDETLKAFAIKCVAVFERSDEWRDDAGKRSGHE